MLKRIVEISNVRVDETIQSTGIPKVEYCEEPIYSSIEDSKEVVTKTPTKNI